MNQQQTKPTKPKPRMIDNILEAYIKVGGFIGVALAIAVFAGICLGSYWLFYIRHFLHMGSSGMGVGDIIIILATFFIASSSAVFVFFSASVFWMPILIGFIFLAPFLQHVVLSLQHMHHP